MPKFYFHVTDGRRLLTDKIGRDFAGLRAARTHAVAALRDARGRLCERAVHDLSGWSMRVTDEAGRVVFTLGFDLRIMPDVPLAPEPAAESTPQGDTVPRPARAKADRSD